MILHKKKQVARPRLGRVTCFYTLSLSHSISHSICLRKRHFLFFSHNFNTAFAKCGVVGFLFVFSVRISSLLRTLLSKSGESCGKFCQKIIFRGFLANFQSWKFTLQLLPLHPPPDLRGAGSIAPVSFPCIYYFCVQ